MRRHSSEVEWGRKSRVGCALDDPEINGACVKECLRLVFDGTPTKLGLTGRFCCLRGARVCRLFVIIRYQWLGPGQCLLVSRDHIGLNPPVIGALPYDSSLNHDGTYPHLCRIQGAARWSVSGVENERGTSVPSAKGSPSAIPRWYHESSDVVFFYDGESVMGDGQSDTSMSGP